jgi:hypothetical protein
MECHHCKVTWQGCAAAAECPQCGAGKGYHEDDRGQCYCQSCLIAANRSLRQQLTAAQQENVRLRKAAEDVIHNGRGRSGGSVFMVNKEQWMRLKDTLARTAKEAGGE